MAKEEFTMVEGTLAPEKKGGDSATIQIRSTDVERLQKVYGDRLKVKGQPASKKAEPAQNKKRTTRARA